MDRWKQLIRKLESEDAEAWLSLRLSALAETPEAFLSSVEEDEALGIAGVAARLSNPFDEAFVLGALDSAGTLIGTIGVYRAEKLKARHKANLWGYYVAPAHRGRGLGRALLEAAVERTRSMIGVDRLCLSVNVKNDVARHLYRSAGFITWGVEPDTFRFEGRRIDDEHMSLDVTARR